MSAPPRITAGKTKLSFWLTLGLPPRNVQPWQTTAIARGPNDRTGSPARALTCSMGCPAGEGKGTVNVLPREKRLLCLVGPRNGNSEVPWSA